MGIEKGISNTEFILHKRKLLFSAGALIGAATGAAITSRLITPRATLTSSTPREDALITDIPPPFVTDATSLALREEYRTARLWHPRTIAAFGSDLREDTPVFQTRDAVRAIKTRSAEAVIISGLATDAQNKRIYVDRDSVLKAKELVLNAISDSGRTPTTLLLSAHGGASGIQIGGYLEQSTGTIENIFITPEELAAAYALKYRSMGARITARLSPDILAFVNCASGNIAERFLTALQQKEIEQEPRRALRSFKPTTPIIFSASTGIEISYINQLLFEMTQHATVGDMYKSADRIGGAQHSNPGIRVPDPETGEPVIVGTIETGTRFT